MVQKAKYESSITAIYRRNEKFLFLSTTLFLISMLIGFFLSDLLYFILNPMVQEFKRNVVQGNIQLTTLSLFTHNASIVLIIYAGGLTLGLITLLYLILNGVFIGYFGTQGPIGDIILLTLPHGIFEIASIIIAGTAGLRLASFMYKFVDGLINETWYGSPFSKMKHVFNDNYDEFKESLILLGISLVLLLVAAFIEANFTLGWYQYLKTSF